MSFSCDKGPLTCDLAADTHAGVLCFSPWYAERKAAAKVRGGGPRLRILRLIAILSLAGALASCLFELKYTVGGTVTGVHGTGLVLEDNASSDLSVNASGAFTFSSRVTKGHTYSVTVRTQPSNSTQTCTVHNGSGTIVRSDINNVVVTCSRAGRYAYVANQTANTISAFAIDSGTGFLTPVAGSPFPSNGSSPAGVAVDPNGTYLYAVNNGSNTVSIYRIDDATGTLSAAGIAVATGSGPAAVALDPTVRFLYVANSGADTVSAFTVQAGLVMPIAASPYAVGREPGALQLDPNGNFLYVTNFADGTVTVLAIDSSTGGLSAVSGSPFGSGAGVAAVAVDPTGGFAYTANSSAASISSFSIDVSTGLFTALSGSPLSTASSPESIAVAPAGTFVFAANVTSANDIATYAIAPASGTLTLSSTAVAGLLPRSVAVDPAGQFVYAANADSGDISVFNVDAATGALTAVSGSPFAAGGGARSIAID